MEPRGLSLCLGGAEILSKAYHHPDTPGGPRPDVCWIVFQRNDQGDDAIAVCLDAKKAAEIKKKDEHGRYIQISHLEGSATRPEPFSGNIRDPTQFKALKALRKGVKEIDSLRGRHGGSEEGQAAVLVDSQSINRILSSIDTILESWALEDAERPNTGHGTLEPGTLSGWAQRIDDELEKLGLVRDEANQIGDFRLRNSLAMPITRLSELSRTVRHSESDHLV